MTPEKVRPCAESRLEKLSCVTGIKIGTTVTHVSCPWCLFKGVCARLVKSHVVFVCPSVAALRRVFRISEFHSYSVRPVWQIFRTYLWGDGSDQE